MRFGLQTIAWGRQLEDIEQLLYDAALSGFEGVEFAQTPTALGVNNVQELLRLMAKYRLHLIGLAGGSLDDRMQFCCDQRPDYLYIEDWEPSCTRAIDASDSRNGTKWLRLGESGSYHCYRFLVLAMTAALAMQA